MWADGGPWFYLCRLLGLEDRDSKIILKYPLKCTAYFQYFSPFSTIIKS